MRWSLAIATAPTLEPITVAEAKLYARIDLSDDDAIVERQIAAARVKAETRTRRAFLQQTWDLYLDQWPGDEIVIPRPPLSSVTYVKYRDEAGAWQTVSSATVYETDTSDEPGRVVLAYNQTWPTVVQRPRAINVRFVAGYGDEASDVPEAIREAIACYVASLYETRQVELTGSISKMYEFSGHHLLDPYVVRDFVLTDGG